MNKQFLLYSRIFLIFSQIYVYPCAFRRQVWITKAMCVYLTESRYIYSPWMCTGLAYSNECFEFIVGFCQVAQKKTGDHSQPWKFLLRWMKALNPLPHSPSDPRPTTKSTRSATTLSFNINRSYRHALTMRWHTSCTIYYTYVYARIHVVKMFKVLFSFLSYAELCCECTFRRIHPSIDMSKWSVFIQQTATQWAPDNDSGVLYPTWLFRFPPLFLHELVTAPPEDRFVRHSLWRYGIMLTLKSNCGSIVASWYWWLVDLLATERET